MKILTRYKQNDILLRIAANNIIVKELGELKAGDEEYLRLVHLYKEHSAYIAKAIGGKNHKKIVEDYIKDLMK